MEAIMINDGRPFDTGIFFSGGAGMFIQYHDIVKPIGLYAIIKMILTEESMGLPINIIKDMSVLSLVEWYMNRRYQNPLQCLDYNHKLDQTTVDRMFKQVLSDHSIYKYSSALNIERMLSVYNKQHMSFPIYVYSETEDPFIKDDCKMIFNGIDVRYVYGDLKEAIKKCDQNFTYIFSKIELVKSVAEILIGTCSHILIADDYRYNYIDNRKQFKYDLRQLQISHPYLRISTTNAVDRNKLVNDITNLYS